MEKVETCRECTLVAVRDGLCLRHLAERDAGRGVEVVAAKDDRQSGAVSMIVAVDNGVDLGRWKGTRVELAAAVGVTERTVYRWEAGAVPRNKLILERLKEVLGD